jgi:hypothetical protein
MMGKESRRAATAANDTLNLTVIRSFNNEMGNVTMRLMKPGNFSTAAKL